VLDGEIAVPDERGVTHIDLLSEALRQRRTEQLAYFAFDLVHLDGHDLRPCPIEDRKALLRDGPASRGGVVPVRPELVAEIRYFGRYRTGWLRDGVLLSIG
jgi:bifunctional non-homologous end joining protein LigD